MHLCPLIYFYSIYILTLQFTTHSCAQSEMDHVDVGTTQMIFNKAVSQSVTSSNLT